MTTFPHLLLVVAGICVAAQSDAKRSEDETPASKKVPYYESAGEGDEAIVLVHGWASSIATWTHQFPELSDRARLLAVDLPGHGKSAPPEGPYTMALFADAVAAAMDDAGVKRAVIVGHSNGTPVALNFWRRYPERTLGIVGVDGAMRAMLDQEQAEAVFAPFRAEGWQQVLAGFIDRMAETLSEEDRGIVKEMALS